MSPADIDRCSMWKFSAAVAGYVTANTPEGQEQMSPEDEDDLWKGVMERM